jgi:putative FmdB family regulatory protein
VPLHEYQCPGCGRFEVLQRFADAPLTACPTCGKEVQRLISAPAIQFKGSGWYVTDYARKPESDAKSSKGAETKSSEAKSSKDAETKSSSDSSPQKSSSTDSSATGSTTGSSPTK